MSALSPPSNQTRAQRLDRRWARVVLVAVREERKRKGRQHFLLSPLDCLSAKAGGAVNGGAYAPFILTVDWLGWLCYL